MPAIAAKGNAAAVMVVKRAPKGIHVPIALHNPHDNEMEDFARANLRTYMSDPDSFGWVEQGAFKDQVLALCGAGPSLAKDRIYPADQVWGCNSAIKWLHEHGKAPDAAIAIDQTEGMLKDWADPPDVTYYVATTVNPKLIAHLREHDRRIVFFHNLVGFDGEVDFYNSHPWPPSFLVGTGATVVTRTIGLAAWLGFRRVDIYGADCCMDGDVAHAGGETIAEAYGAPMVMECEMFGKKWLARPDMLMSAVDLAKVVRDHPGKVRLMGDTLPVALMGMDDAFLDSVICRTDSEGKPPGFDTLEDFHEHLAERNS